MQPRSKATRAAIGAGVRARRQYRDVASAARALMYSGSDPDTLMEAVQECLALAPDREQFRQWRRVEDVLLSGRTVRIKTYPVTFVYPVDAEMTREIESALSDVEL